MLMVRQLKSAMAVTGIRCEREFVGPEVRQTLEVRWRIASQWLVAEGWLIPGRPDKR